MMQTSGNSFQEMVNSRGFLIGERIIGGDLASAADSLVKELKKRLAQEWPEQRYESEYVYNRPESLDLAARETLIFGDLRITYTIFAERQLPSGQREDTDLFKTRVFPALATPFPDKLNIAWLEVLDIKRIS
jgi:hypothetical protein